jgi:hypothetical protein
MKLLLPGATFTRISVAGRLQLVNRRRMLRNSRHGKSIEAGLFWPALTYSPLTAKWMPPSITLVELDKSLILCYQADPARHPGRTALTRGV